MLRRPDACDGRLKFHPVDHHARHDQVPVTVIKSAIVIQNLRRNNSAVRLSLAANNPPTFEGKVFNATSKLIHLGLVDTIHHVCLSHWLHTLGGAVQLNGLPQDES